MEIKPQIKIEKVILELSENEAEELKDLIEFAFDYDAEHPHSLYGSEKILGRNIIDKLTFDHIGKDVGKDEEDREIDLRGMYIDKTGKLHNDYDKEENENEKKV